MLKKIRWYHVTALAAFAFIFGPTLVYDLLYPPDFSSSVPVTTIEKASKPEKTDFVGSGDVAYLSQDVLAALTKEGAEELQNYLIAKNYDAADRMISRGELFSVKSGTEVTVIDRGFIYAHIEIHGTGQRGYLPGEYLRK